MSLKFLYKCILKTVMSGSLKNILKFCSRSFFLSRTNTLNFNFRAQFVTSSVGRQEPQKMEHLQSNPFFDKYAEKLKKLKESSNDEFNSRVTSMLEEKKLKDQSLQSGQNEPTQLKTDTLDSIMNLSLVLEKSPEEITEVWKAYFENKDAVFAVIPTEEYKEICQKSKDFPVFVYPLPRGEGYEFFVQQWNSHGCHFTPLLTYQTHKENAPTCLSLKHYTELADDKGIVLMVGQPDLNILSVRESQLLALQVKMYYGIQSALKFNLVRVFNNSPDTFDYKALIREFENYKKDVKSKAESDSSKKL